MGPHLVRLERLEHRAYLACPEPQERQERQGSPGGQAVVRSGMEGSRLGRTAGLIS